MPCNNGIGARSGNTIRPIRAFPVQLGITLRWYGRAPRKSAAPSSVAARVSKSNGPDSRSPSRSSSANTARRAMCRGASRRTSSTSRDRCQLAFAAIDHECQRGRGRLRNLACLHGSDQIELRHEARSRDGPQRRSIARWVLGLLSPGADHGHPRMIRRRLVPLGVKMHDPAIGC